MLAASLVLPVGCIHTESRTSADVALGNVDAHPMQRLGVQPLQVDGFVYNRRSHLERLFGSTTDDDALTEFLNAGLVPVYIRVQNVGARPATLTEDRLLLTDGNVSVAPTPAAMLPNSFDHFSPAAAAANVFNTVVVVVGSAAIAATLLVSSYSGGLHSGDVAPFATPYASDMVGDRQNRVFNSTTRTTVINFHGYLLEGGLIAEGQARAGLLFFRVPPEARVDSLHLTLQPDEPSSG